MKINQIYYLKDKNFYNEKSYLIFLIITCFLIIFINKYILINFLIFNHF
jgi:hypothetical protein